VKVLEKYMKEDRNKFNNSDTVRIT